jgi:ABC-type sugar transport system ATPase subunit
VLILDEPTAALTDAEANRLFGQLGRLAERDVAIVFITHRLDEIDRVAQRIVVMRNGEVVERFDGGAPSRRELVRAMLGRHLQERAPRAERARGPRRLAVRDLDVADPQMADKLRVKGASMAVHGGEIVGLYGLVGAGRTELLHALFGSWPGRVTGEVMVDGRPLAPGSVRDAMRNGLGLLSEDRKTSGVLPGQTVHANLSAASLGRVSRGSLIDRAREIERNRELIAQLDVRPPRLGALIGDLSGGNQQKVLLGRCLATEPSVLLLDEPSLGVDVGSRFQIYQHIRALADDGMAILLVSSDIEEVDQECDRILVMYKGAIAGEFPGTCDRHELLAAATGGNA